MNRFHFQIANKFTSICKMCSIHFQIATKFASICKMCSIHFQIATKFASICKMCSINFRLLYTEWVGRISHCKFLQVYTDCVGHISHSECFAGAHGMCWSHIQLRIFAGMIGLMRVTNLTKWGESVINLHKLDEFKTVSPLFNENLIPVF